jgi:hypothetical protein
MKKVILALGLLLAVGGGCVSVGKLGADKTVEGDWYLAFDLPSGWVMTAPYQAPNTEAVAVSQDVDRDSNEIYLQTTDKAIVGGGIAPDAEVPTDSYVSLLPDNTQIRVSRLDPGRHIPDGAEDLGNSFYKVELCEDGEDCQIGGRHNYDYYLETEDAKYKFIVYGVDTDKAEDIITSAEVVTETEEVIEE